MSICSMRPKCKIHCKTNKEPPTENKMTPKTRRCAQAVWDPVQDTTAHTQLDGKAGEKLLSGLKKIEIVFVQILIFETFLVERFSRANVPHLPRGRELDVKRSGTKTRPTSTEGARSASFHSTADFRKFWQTYNFLSISLFLSGFTLTIKEIWLPNGTAHLTVYTRPLSEHCWQYFSKVS